VVEHGAERQQDFRPVGAFVEVITSPGAGLRGSGGRDWGVPAASRLEAWPGLGQGVEPAHSPSREGRSLTAGRFPPCQR
jgi:hypothetical protein